MRGVAENTQAAFGLALVLAGPRDGQVMFRFGQVALGQHSRRYQEAYCQNE